MRYKVQTEDFFVEEQIPLSLEERGQFAVCRVCKQGVTTLSVRRQMARILNVHQSAITFPVLKDKQAIAVQYATVQGQAPKRMAGPGFEAEFLGRTERPLTPADITANRFTLILRDLTDAETATIHTRARQATTFGLPNYFDRQRFGSLSPGRDHIAKLILQRDAEGAVRAYLSHHFVGDPQPVRKFKAFAARHWGDWDTLFDAAPSPSNFRSVLTYLRDHPQPTETEWRKALNLINRRLLSIYLSAYQSLLWNRIVSRCLAHWLAGAPAPLEIAREALTLYHTLPDDFERERQIALPSHRARYPGPDSQEGVYVPGKKGAAALPPGHRPLGGQARRAFPGPTPAYPVLCPAQRKLRDAAGQGASALRGCVWRERATCGDWQVMAAPSPAGERCSWSAARW